MSPTPEALTSLLSSHLSDVARALFAAGGVDETVQAVVDLAVSTVDGCDTAGIFMMVEGSVSTVVVSDPLVEVIDGLQRQSGEGPCLDAISQATTVYAEDLAFDIRWPTFAPEAVAAGVRCVLALSLVGNGAPGALNLYAGYPGAFGATDRAKGVIFATLAGLALQGARMHEDEDRRTDNLHLALDTRAIIGQAQGILMERDHITSDQAFDVLRRASQHLNVKLREVAQDLVDTGATPARADPHPLQQL